jgi:N-methylhydantoinase B
LVAEEVRNGIVSVQAARDYYGVVVNESGFSVDERATDELRGNSSE